MAGLDGIADRASQELADRQASPETVTSDATQTRQQETSTAKSVDQAIIDLDKASKFSFDGRELTRDQLKNLFDQEKKFQSMDKDYTTKTQKIAEERKSIETDRKFYENLAYDLQNVKNNPALAAEFVKIYPQAFHKYIEEFLKAPSHLQSVQQQPNVDVKTLSRLERLEKFYNDQEVTKNEQLIKSTVDELAKKYPGTEKPLAQKMIMAEAYEAHMNKIELTPEVWEDIFKRVKEERDADIKAEYGDMVKKQTEANSKSRDVAPGGGTSGRAPQKIALKDVAATAIRELGGR